MARAPTGTITFLFTDVEGSTKLWERGSETMSKALARHDEILREAIDAHEGRVFKTVGDAFCAAFLAPPGALEAALEAQRGLLEEQWAQTGPLKVRMALHTGATEERGGDYFGPPVNRVARLLSAAHGGQVLLSLPTYELVRDQLPAGVGIRDLGEHRLKDLFRLERVFQIMASGLPSEFPPLRTLEGHPNNLLLQPTPLVGREREVAEVAQRLLASETRLLTLTGPGGTGKTRLVLQATADLLEEFEDGTFFVSLAALSDPQLVASAIAAPLGISEAGNRPLEEGIKEYLREKKLLLVLDNFEQVLEGARLVGQLLSACPDLKVLATSRIPLSLYGEREYPVPPLSLPDPKRLPSLERLSQYEAVKLFIERAQDARPDFAVTNESAPAVAEICARLDGLPLAIELAAVRIKVLPPQKMLDRLSDRLRLLTGGARDLPERQRTLRATMEWSHALLEEGEKTLFARLSVFAGGRTLEAMEAICDAEDDLPVEVLDGVESLVNKNLLREEEGLEGEPRFYMLETVHEFAREKLEQSGEARELRMLHAEYFLSLAEEAEPELIGPRETQWFDRLEEEHDNMRGVLSWAIERGESELGLRLAGALRLFWIARRYYGEGRRWLEQALAKEGGASAIARAEALRAATLLAFWQGNLDRMRASATEGLRLSSEAGLGSSHAALFSSMLGYVSILRGDPDQATQLAEEGLTLSRKADDAEGIENSLHILGMISSRRGDQERAKEFYEEGLAFLRELGSTFWRGPFLYYLGMTSLLQGDLEQATALLEEATELARRQGSRAALKYVIGGLGWVALLRGNLERAKALHKESLTLCKELGDKKLASDRLEGLACVAGAEGESTWAARLFGAAWALMEAIGYQQDHQERALREPYLVAARSQLDEAVWEVAFAEGKTMRLEEAVEYALTEKEVATPSSPTPEQPSVSAQPPALTRREEEVAALVARGLTNRQIASDLSISEHTAATHVRRILKKLGFHSRTKLASWIAESSADQGSKSG